MLSEFTRLCAQPYRPGGSAQNAPVIYRRFSAAGQLLSEIGFFYPEPAQQLFDKMKAAGHNVTLEERG